MKIAEACYAVTGLGYSTPWCVNAGFIVGDHTTLIVDTGANALAASSILGYALAAKPNNRLLAINTEKHFDHIGGNSFLKDHGVEIWGHAKLHRTPEEFTSEIVDFNSGILNPARRQAFEAEAFFADTKLALPDRTFDQDMRFDLGNCEVQVLLTPGHTETNISVWLPSDRVLFSGDCLINKYLPNLDAATPEGWRVWQNSLDRIQALHPETVVPGHGPIAQKADVEKIINNVRQTLQRALETGASPTTVSS